MMRDRAILSDINRLAGDEHKIWQRESRGEATAADRERLRQIEATLDRCWDLLNQRRARRAARRGPGEAEASEAEEAEENTTPD
jgi:hypothetical protein